MRHVRHIGAACRLTDRSMSAPVRATSAASQRTSRTGPAMVISSAAAPSGFPTSRLAIRNAARSRAPDGGTPRSMNP